MIGAPAPADVDTGAGRWGRGPRIVADLGCRPPQSGGDLPGGIGDARGPEWVALVVLVAVLVVFGMVPGLALAPVDTATVPLLSRIVGP